VHLTKNYEMYLSLFGCWRV